MNILVVGGAGYIGSHVVWLLGQRGETVVTLDNLSSGHRDAVLHGELVVGDLADRDLLDQLFSSHKFDAVMHFASFIQVGESLREPSEYYRNNVVNSLNLLESMKVHDVKCFVFSSTAAVFGEPDYSPIDEAHQKRPINPYGRTKLMVETILADFDYAYGIKSACLRYFNAAGAHPQALLGERHNPETHLIPLVLQVASARLPFVTVFGRDYDTPDGTCIRDFVHVMDLAEAHLLALNHLMTNGESITFNLGNGNGFSVQEVVEMARRVTGMSIPIFDGQRREGDPPRLVADSKDARSILGWSPCYADLEAIILHAWEWEKKLHLYNFSQLA
jgi:UDP-glucose 4-epimerase